MEEEAGSMQERSQVGELQKVAKLQNIGLTKTNCPSGLTENTLCALQGSLNYDQIFEVAKHLNDGPQLRKLAHFLGVEQHIAIGFIRDNKSTSHAGLEVLQKFWDQEADKKVAWQKLGAALMECKLKDVACKVLGFQ